MAFGDSGSTGGSTGDSSVLRLAGGDPLSAFFHDALQAAMKNQGVLASELTEFYLVNLLSDFAHGPLDDAPLALEMAAAQNAPPAERAQRLRTIGDRSLYVSGFFADSLHRRLVDVDYYCKMGGTAYRLLARTPTRKNAAFSSVYAELAERFRGYVDVLAEVSVEPALHSDEGWLHLYERYMRTGSEWIARKLRARGVVPRRGEVQ